MPKSISVSLSLSISINDTTEALTSEENFRAVKDYSAHSSTGRSDPKGQIKYAMVVAGVVVVGYY